MEEVEQIEEFRLEPLSYALHHTDKTNPIFLDYGSHFSELFPFPG